MRTLAVDWGLKKTGLAICDELGLTVRPLTTLRGAPQQVIPRISNYVTEYQVVRVVVGLPLGADGSLGTAAQRVLSFVESLKAALPCPVETWNERLTSYAAEEWMRDHGVPLKDRERRSDEIAAAILLEDYLSAHPDAGF